MICSVLIGAALLVIVLVPAAFRAARRRAARRLPRALAAELRHHKLECLHEPPERVQLELELLLGEPPATSRRLRSREPLVQRFPKLTGRGVPQS